MVEGLVDRLAKILPNGRGVWIPMDHGISAYPEKGRENRNHVVSSCISGGADAIILQKGALSHFVETTGWSNFVCHVSVSTVNAGKKDQYKVRVATADECLIRGATAVSAQINLGDPFESEMIKEMGLNSTTLTKVITSGYDLLNLINYFTCGPKETRSWTINKNTLAPQAAGKIHSDFEKGFIRAETVAYDDFIKFKGEAGSRDAGKLRQEGKDYIVKNGDVMHFLFNV